MSGLKWLSRCASEVCESYRSCGTVRPYGMASDLTSYEHWYLLQGDVWSSTAQGTHALCIKMHDCCFIFPLLRYLPDAAEQLLSDINNFLSHYARPKE